MKKYFMIGLGVVLALSLTIILYGAWLNEVGEFQIARRMSERSLELQGSRAAVRFIRPKVTLTAINFYYYFFIATNKIYNIFINWILSSYFVSIKLMIS